MVIAVNELQKYIEDIFKKKVKSFYFIEELYQNLEYCFDIHCEVEIIQQIITEIIISLHIVKIENSFSYTHIYNINTDYNTDRPSKEIFYILNTYLE